MKLSSLLSPPPIRSSSSSISSFFAVAFGIMRFLGPPSAEATGPPKLDERRDVF
jgi:hypothetical protein